MGFQADIQQTAARPIRQPMACDVCGAVFARARLADFHVRTLAGITGLDPGRCEPAEYAVECPECGCRDGFQPAILCAECGQRPCQCRTDPLPWLTPSISASRGDLS